MLFCDGCVCGWMMMMGRCNNKNAGRRKIVPVTASVPVLPRATSGGQPDGRPQPGADRDVKDWGVAAPPPPLSAQVVDRQKMTVI